MLKVKKQTLLIFAGAVWLIAGINILRIGIESFINCFDANKVLKYLLIIAGAIIIFIGFYFMFSKIVKKHTKRILGYKEEKKSIFYFFDAKGYILMIFMMGLGIGLRSSNLLPTEFFAVFYNGLGSALSIAGVIFIKNYILSKNRITGKNHENE